MQVAAAKLPKLQYRCLHGDVLFFAPCKWHCRASPAHVRLQDKSTSINDCRVLGAHAYGSVRLFYLMQPLPQLSPLLKSHHKTKAQVKKSLVHAYSPVRLFCFMQLLPQLIPLPLQLCDLNLLHLFLLLCMAHFCLSLFYIFSQLRERL